MCLLVSVGRLPKRQTRGSTVHSEFSWADDSQDAWLSLGVLVAGLMLLLVASTSAWVDRYLCRAISWALRRFTQLDAHDYARLLHLREDYGVSELQVTEPFAQPVTSSRTLSRLRLKAAHTRSGS